MTNNGSANDPKNIWDSQETNPRPISVEEIRSFAGRRASRKRLKRFVFLGAFLLYMAISIGVRMSTAERGVLHMGWVGVVRFALLITWVLGVRYYVADRPMSLDINAAIPGMEFYRRELLAQLEYFRDKSRWVPGLIIVISFFTVTIGVDPRLALPLVILFAIFAAFWYRQWKQDLPQLENELRSLDRIRNSGSL